MAAEEYFLLLVATSDWHELFFRCRTVLPVLVLTFSFVCLLPTCFFLVECAHVTMHIWVHAKKYNIEM